MDIPNGEVLAVLSMSPALFGMPGWPAEDPPSMALDVRGVPRFGLFLGKTWCGLK
jgi:hypothetical protein